VKEFFLKKLTLRVGYIVGAYFSAQAAGLLAEPSVQAVLANAGVSIQILDPIKLKMAIGLGVMVAGEFLYELFHKKVVLPQVAPKAEIQDTPATK
jgi:hypothetical protein